MGGFVDLWMCGCADVRIGEEDEEKIPRTSLSSLQVMHE